MYLVFLELRLVSETFLCNMKDGLNETDPNGLSRNGYGYHESFHFLSSNVIDFGIPYMYLLCRPARCLVCKPIDLSYLEPAVLLVEGYGVHFLHVIEASSGCRRGLMIVSHIALGDSRPFISIKDSIEANEEIKVRSIIKETKLR